MIQVQHQQQKKFKNVKLNVNYKHVLVSIINQIAN